MNRQDEQALKVYAAQLKINDMPGYTHIMTTDSRYVRVSDNVLSLIGYQSHAQIENTRYQDMPCKASQNHAQFESEDRLALSREIKTLSYSHFRDWYIFLGCKKPIYRGHRVIGIFANFMDMTYSNLIDISHFLLSEDNNTMHKKQFSYVIDNIKVWGLTRKEQECLFFLLRGLSYKEISARLYIQITTVQTHVEHIKHKFGVNTKSKLVQKAIRLGWRCRIPASLFR